MSKLRHILKLLADETVCISKYKTVPRNIRNIFFITSGQKFISQNIYIGDSKQALEALEKEPIRPGSVIIACEADSSERFKPLYLDRDIIFIALRCDQKKTFNIIAQALDMYRQWKDTFYAMQLSGEKTEAIIDIASQLGKTGIIFLDDHFKPLYTSGLQSDMINEIISSKGKKLGSTKELILGPEGEKCRKYIIKNKTAYLCTVRGEAGNEMYIACEAQNRGTDYPTLLINTVKNIERSRFLRNKDQSLAKDGLNEILNDVIHGGQTDGETIKKRIEDLSTAGAHYSIAVAEFGNNMSTIPYSYFMQQLTTVLPGSLMTMFEGKIVALLFHDKRQHGYPFDREMADEMLKGLNAWMGVSNSFQSYGMMKTSYYMAVSTLKLAKKLRNEPDHRAFLHDEYSVYHAIDLCAKQYNKDLGHSHLLYLVHPAVITLSRYDAENNNNLRDVLFYYLVNNKSLVKTAAMTYMHRNTIVNKLNKINELLGLDLEDGYLLQRLLFSCQVLRYAEMFLNDNVLSPIK